MPVDYSQYPDNWLTEVRPRILRRAGGDDDNPPIGARCEWCGAENYQPHPITGSRVVLTIAHLDDPDPMNVSNNNLAALCQKCHNTYDMPMRAKNRAQSKRQRQIDSGQLAMFGDRADNVD